MTLSVEQERAVLAVLREEWKHWNQARFRRAMRAPVLILSDTETRLGQWERATRTLSLSRTFVASSAWPLVVEVLKHEMAHQFVSEVLEVHDEPAHGPTFQRVCRDRAIDARAAGRPRQEEEDPRTARVAATVQKLLALAGSDNVHEAETAMRAARRLLAQHNLGEAETVEPELDYLHVGPVLLRVHEWQRLLASLLCEHFFVEAIWVSAYIAETGRRGSQLELCGTPANLRIAEYVHGYLSASAPRLWATYKTRERIGGDRERLPYFAGLMNGFRDQLRQDAKSEAPGAPAEPAMVHVAHEILQRFYRARHPYVRTVRYGGASRGEAFAGGESDGRALTLRRPLEPSGAGTPRLLPGRRG